MSPFMSHKIFNMIFFTDHKARNLSIAWESEDIQSMGIFSDPDSYRQTHIYPISKYLKKNKFVDIIHSPVNFTWFALHVF